MAQIPSTPEYNRAIVNTCAFAAVCCEKSCQVCQHARNDITAQAVDYLVNVILAALHISQQCNLGCFWGFKARDVLQMNNCQTAASKVHSACLMLHEIMQVHTCQHSHVSRLSAVFEAISQHPYIVSPGKLAEFAWPSTFIMYNHQTPIHTFCMFV